MKEILASELKRRMLNCIALMQAESEKDACFILADLTFTQADLVAEFIKSFDIVDFDEIAPEGRKHDPLSNTTEQ